MQAALRWGNNDFIRYISALLLLLLLCGLLLGGVTLAQEGSDPADNFGVVILREPGPDAVGAFARLAVEPQTGTPVIMARQAGARFGQDSVLVEVFEDDGWAPLPLDGLLDEATNIITPQGIDVAFDADGSLYTAINREFPDDGAGVARTLVTRLGSGGWVRVGEPVGDTPTIGPLYLFDAAPGLTLATIEGGEDFDELRVRAFDGDAWAPLGEQVLNIDPSSDAESVFAAADSAGRPLMAWTEYASDIGITLAFADYWDGDAWLPVPDLPLVADIEIGDVTLVDLATGRDGSVYLLTREPAGQTSYADVWYQTDDYEFEWFDNGLPREADRSPCATGQAVAAGPGGFGYYAWMEPCENLIRFAFEDPDSGEWVTANEVILTADLPSEAPPLQLAVNDEGVAFLLWVEANGTRNGGIGVAAFVPR